MSDMSDRFDDLLSGAVDTATRAASAPGAETARRRGSARRTRRRLAASAMSLVLLGAVGGMAAVTLGGTSQHTPAGSPTPGASQSWTVISSPNPHPGTSQGSTAAVPNPDTVVLSAWLTAAQLPLGAGYSGTWVIQPTEGTVGALLSDSVYKVQPAAEFCSELITGSALSTVGTGAEGQQYRSFDASQSFTVTGQAQAGYADQQILFFPTAAAAKSAWNTLPTDFAGCKQQLTIASSTNGGQSTGWVQQTVNQSDAECWSTLATGTSTQSTADGILVHFCFVRAGKLITAVNVSVHQDGSFSVVDFGSTDPTTVSDLRQALNTAYGAAY